MVTKRRFTAEQKFSSESNETDERRHYPKQPPQVFDFATQFIQAFGNKFAIDVLMSPLHLPMTKATE